MTDTLAPVIPFTPRATRTRKPNRRPGSVPKPGFAALAEICRDGGITSAEISAMAVRGAAYLCPANRRELAMAAAILEAADLCPA